MKFAKFAKFAPLLAVLRPSPVAAAAAADPRRDAPAGRSLRGLTSSCVANGDACVGGGLLRRDECCDGHFCGWRGAFVCLTSDPELEEERHGGGCSPEGGRCTMDTGARAPCCGGRNCTASPRAVEFGWCGCVPEGELCDAACCDGFACTDISGGAGGDRVCQRA